MVWYFIEWFNHVQGPYPMEGQPPSGWLTFYAMLPLSLVCFSAIYGCMIWYAPVPLFLAGLVNIIWPLLMFNSWYGEMSWSYWSCWMVGGSLNLWVFFIPPILAGLIYWATQHNENLKDAPYYILATTTFVISSIWYTEDWII